MLVSDSASIILNNCSLFIRRIRNYDVHVHVFRSNDVPSFHRTAELG